MSIPTREPIIVQFNHFDAPARFRWQGKTYAIDVIERIWRSTQGKRPGQRIYQVRSRGKRFTLHYDQHLRRWTLVRAPWRIRLSLAVERLAAHIAV